jgi:hypothetical protein
LSKASEWAAEIQRAKDHLDHAKSAQRPAPFELDVSAREKWWFSADEDGRPRLVTPEARVGYQPQEQDLIDLAHWILATFWD